MRAQRWVRCPLCGSTETRVLIVADRQIGVRCVSCDARSETPVEVVEPCYRTVSRSP